MEKWDRSNRHRRENPSFSSTLLDAIYRSIDDSNGGSGKVCREEEEKMVFYREKMVMRKSNIYNEEEEADIRACMVEKWMEKKKKKVSSGGSGGGYQKVQYGASVRRKSMADFDEKPDFLMNSSSSSSESSCGTGGGFSSSESDSIYSLNNSRSSSSMQRPKPIRTSVSARPIEKFERPLEANKREGGGGGGGGSFVKTKSRALKIYGDLKKVKQPISPGGRLASFLNSLFTAGNAKKAKISSSSPSGYDGRKLQKSVDELQPSSTCSSASSFSRSCLSKTPSSRGGKVNNNNNNINGAAKRSVRFYPVSVIVGEDCRPCGHKNLYESEENIMTITTARDIPANEELKFRLMNENRRVEEVARELLKSYDYNNQKKQRKTDELFFGGSIDDSRRHCHSGHEEEEEDEEDDDDAASYASSDLFELDNLSAIGGIERYREELPVYETTHLGTNRAIANGFIL